MVEPSWCHRAKRRWVAMGVGLCGLGLGGCSFVPKSRLDECHRLSQTLQAENDRLKDTAISLRSQNQDLNQRAVDDGRRHRVQEEEIQRLVQSVSAYQEDRDKLAVAFERIKSQIRSSVNPVSSSLLRQLQDLAQAHPGWEFDPERGVLTIPAAQLFEAGSDQLRVEAENRLRETAALWKAPEASDIDVLVIGRNETSAVRRTALSPEEANGQDQGRPLGLARASRVRERLAGLATIDPARIEVAGFEIPHAGADDDLASQARNRRIEIHLRRHAVESPPSDPKAPVPKAAAAGTDRRDP
jgi:chemotaxis protein MotB